MQTSLNIQKLHGLLANLHEITRLQFSLHDTNGHEIHSVHSRSKFCDLLCSTEKGRCQCVHCDAQAVSKTATTLKPFQYRCHAGLIDTAIPVTEHGQVVMIILFGQVLDDSPLEAQWQRTWANCHWFEDVDRLLQSFLALPRLTTRQIEAYLQIINACVSEVRLEGLIKTSTQTDAQRLEGYIRAHYAEPLTLTDLSAALSLSKSRLCQLAPQVSPGMTVTGLVTHARMDAAKGLLANPDATVREVAFRIGIPDYNYFARVFKKHTGLTPTAYRQGLREK